MVLGMAMVINIEVATDHIVPAWRSVWRLGLPLALHEANQKMKIKPTWTINPANRPGFVLK